MKPTHESFVKLLGIMDEVRPLCLSTNEKLLMDIIDHLVDLMGVAIGVEDMKGRD